MPETNPAIMTQINRAVHLRYEMEIRRGCTPAEARRLAMITAEYVTQALDGPERMRVLLHVAYGLDRRS